MLLQLCHFRNLSSPVVDTDCHDSDDVDGNDIGIGGGNGGGGGSDTNLEVYVPSKSRRHE